MCLEMTCEVKILSSQENFPLYRVDKMLLISEFVRDGRGEVIGGKPQKVIL